MTREQEKAIDALSLRFGGGFAVAQRVAFVSTGGGPTGRTWIVDADGQTQEVRPLDNGSTLEWLEAEAAGDRLPRTPPQRVDLRRRVAEDRDEADGLR